MRGSCWVNACLQAVFSIPGVRARYGANTFEPGNAIDECLCLIWNTRAAEGLGRFFEHVRTEAMPAGTNIGDAHELFLFLCDKLPFLDKLCRFEIVDVITCKACGDVQRKTDSVIEQPVMTDGSDSTLAECMMSAVAAHEIDGWACEKCKSSDGCLKQLQYRSFPTALVVYKLAQDGGGVKYSNNIVVNGHKYGLVSVSCYNGAHWWGLGRELGDNEPWLEFDDERVSERPLSPPISKNMRMLIYYRLEN